MHKQLSFGAFKARCRADRQAYRYGLCLGDARRRALFGTTQVPTGSGNPAVQFIAAPSGLGWTLPFNVRKWGNRAGLQYDTDLAFDTLKPAYVYTYYVSPTGSGVASPADNDPNTPVTMARFQTLGNANGGIVRAVLENSVFYAANGVIGATSGGTVYEPWAGHGSLDKPTICLRSTSAVPTWTADTGTTYTTSHSVTTYSEVWDLLYADTNGIPSKLIVAASIAACRSTPGSAFYDSVGTKMYVNAIDGRNLVGDTNIMVPTTGTAFNVSNTAATTYWIDGLRVIGGTTFGGPTSGTANIVTVYNRNSQWLGGAGNGLGVTGRTDVFSINPACGGSAADGLNYHGATPYFTRFLEVNTRSLYNGYNASGTNNTSTCHDNCIGVCVAGDYAGSADRPIHDINSAARWMIGSYIHASGGSGSTAITVQAGTGSGSGDTTQMWLENCTVENSTTGALYCDTSATINYSLTTNDLITSGLGTFAPYKHSSVNSVVATFTDHAVDAVDRSSYTFSGLTTMGGLTRVSFTFRAVQTITSVVIGGVTAKPISNVNDGSNVSATYVAYVPPGTAGSVVINLGGSTGRCGIAVWKITGTQNNIPYRRGQSASGTATATLVIPANGAAIGYGGALATAGSSSWTNLTKRFDETVEATMTHTGADVMSAAGGSTALTLTWTGFSGGETVFETWGP